MRLMRGEEKPDQTLRSDGWMSEGQQRIFDTAINCNTPKNPLSLPFSSPSHRIACFDSKLMKSEKRSMQELAIEGARAKSFWPRAGAC
jgi:hypothetical protein